MDNGDGGSEAARRLWLALVLGALGSFAALSIDMYLPALPSLSSDLHAGASLGELSLTAVLLGLALGQLLAGPPSDVYGRRRPLLAGLLAYTVASLLCAVSPSIWWLIFFRLVQGLAGATGIAISRAIVRDLYSGPELTRFLGVLMVIFGVGPILAPVLGGQLLRVTSWRGVFVALAVIGAIMFIAVAFGLPETLAVHLRRKAGFISIVSTLHDLTLDKAFMGYAIAQGLVATALFAYISGSPFVIQDLFGASPQLFSLFFAINGLGIIMMGNLTGRMAGRIKEEKLFLCGLGIAAFGSSLLLIIILSGGRLYSILPPLFLVVSSVGMVMVSGSSLALQRYEHSAGSASALLGLLSMIFGAAVAPLVGLGGNRTAVPMGIAIAAGDIGAVLCYVILKRHGQGLIRP